MFYKNYLSWRTLISILPLLCVLLHYLPWLLLENPDDSIWDCEDRFNGFFNYSLFLSFLGFVVSPGITALSVYLDCNKVSLLPVFGMQLMEAFWTLAPEPSDTSYNSVWWLSYIYVEIVLFVFYFFLVFVILDRKNKERVKIEAQLCFIKTRLLNLKYNLNV